MSAERKLVSPSHASHALPPHQPCPCCFDLDTASVSHTDVGDSPDITVSNRESIVCLRRSMKVIQKAAASACSVCSILVEILVFFDMHPYEDGRETVFLRIPVRPGNVELSFSTFGHRKFVQLYTSHGRFWNNVRPLPEKSKDHLSSNSLAFMKSCLGVCLQKHSLCHQSPGPLPTRLLDVGHRNDSAVRLIETNNLTRASYIALSYCWGNAVTSKTTLATLKSMKLGLQVSSLPQAYIDAITLTRELGIRYLWIDALCIIQDCDEDWENESAKMSDIYARAHLTIAAASSDSAIQPFLRCNPQNVVDNDQDFQRIFSKRVGDGEDLALIKARVIPESGVHWKWQESSAELTITEPLLRRGWTLQEELLSTRLLSFTSTEMQWTCQEIVFCECRSRLNERRRFGHKPFSRLKTVSGAFRFWHKVVEDYSKRVLTKNKDKLPAISGIAQSVQQKTTSEYAAGLWADNVDLDLLWRRAAAITKPTQIEFTAPSFSWASIDGEIDYYCFRNGKQPYRKISEVVAIEASASSKAPLGCVRGGQLTIRGPLALGVLEEAEVDGGAVLTLGATRLAFITDTVLQGAEITDSKGSVQNTACRWDPSVASELEELETGNDQSLAKLVRSLPSPGTQCWALRLGYFPESREHEVLILGKSLTNPEAFERLGLVSIDDGDQGQAFALSIVSTIVVM